MIYPPNRTRLPDWEQRLFTFLNEARVRPLEWGRFDCVIGLAGGAVKAQTGDDLISPHLGKYSDRREATAYMRKHGWDGLEVMMTQFLKRASSNDRHRGNIILLHSDLGPAFGVRVGRDAVAFSASGLRPHRIPEPTIEWSVTT